MEQFLPGDAVRLLFDIKNDGTFYGVQRGTIMQPAGARGYVAYRNDLADLTVYEVHFPESNTTMGCRDKELIPGDDPWSPPAFKKGDVVAARIDLTQNQAVLVPEGTVGQVSVIRFQKNIGYIYEVRFKKLNDQYCLLTEAQLVGSNI